VEAMKKGAFDFLTKPVDLEHLRLLVSRAGEHLKLVRENRKLHSRLEGQDTFRKIVRRSPSMQAAATVIKQVALSDVPVLLRGETGAGKDLVARAIHERSRRANGPFVAVNCGGFTEELFASELFGHVRGAFTGAHADKPGRFALADGGTLFLDEVGEVPLKNQVELLRVLENREYQAVGDPQIRHADVRIIAATNRDLEASVQQGAFREDLYYRLNVVPIDVPPLRERHEDIPVLAEMFLEEACRAQEEPRKELSPEALEHLIRHRWPGNVRQLRNLVQRLVVTCPDRIIRAEHLPGVQSAADAGLGGSRPIAGRRPRCWGSRSAPCSTRSSGTGLPECTRTAQDLHFSPPSASVGARPFPSPGEELLCPPLVRPPRSSPAQGLLTKSEAVADLNPGAGVGSIGPVWQG
jgi:two-component system response regulator AtoC